MRRITLIGLSLALLIGTTAAHASGGHHRDRHFAGYKHGHHYRPYRYDRYRGYRHHRHHRDSHRGAYLIGGAILGSVITHALTRPARDYDERVYTDQRRVIRSDAPVSRRLYRDRDGNCFETRYTRDGTEIMQELDPAACSW